MDEWLYIALIYLLGLGLCVAELFIPSGGVLGIAATICIAYSLWHLVSHGFVWAAVVCVIVTVIYVFVMVRWGFRRFRSDTSLAESFATGVDVREASSLIGSEGEAITALRPAGVASFGGRRYDVLTRGGFVEAGARVTVIETSGNRILVKPL